MRNGIGFITEDRKSEGLMLEDSIMKNISVANLGRISKKGVLIKKTENDLVKEAKIRANEIIALAQRDAKAIRIGSREYSTEILSQLDREIEEKKNKLIVDMQKSFEMVAKEIDENLCETGSRIKDNISELRGM